MIENFPNINLSKFHQKHFLEFNQSLNFSNNYQMIFSTYTINFIQQLNPSGQDCAILQLSANQTA